MKNITFIHWLLKLVGDFDSKKISIIFLFLVAYSSFGQQKEYTKILLLMGSRFEFSVVSTDSVNAFRGIQQAIDSIQRIENFTFQHQIRGLDFTFHTSGKR